jgi:hypothetical protein
MTMRLTIKNEDQSRTAVVKTIDTPSNVSTEYADKPDVEAATAEIAPGQTAEFWIHNGRKLDVTEKQ